jgi:putative FmdB family regulatory protein
MPVYEYRCKSCGKTHEIEHGFHDERPTECPSCGGTLVRVFHPIGVVFKGSGFHKTDYGGSGKKPAAPATAEGKASDPKSADAKGADSMSGDAKSEGTSQSKSPATKPEAKSSTTPGT